MSDLMNGVVAFCNEIESRLLDSGMMISYVISKRIFHEIQSHMCAHKGVESSGEMKLYGRPCRVDPSTTIPVRAEICFDE